MPSAGSCAGFLPFEFLDLRKFRFSYCCCPSGPLVDEPHWPSATSDDDDEAVGDVVCEACARAAELDELSARARALVVFVSSVAVRARSSWVWLLGVGVGIARDLGPFALPRRGCRRLLAFRRRRLLAPCLRLRSRRRRAWRRRVGALRAPAAAAAGLSSPSSSSDYS